MENRVVILRSNPVNPDSRVEKEALSLANAGYDVSILCWDRESNHELKSGDLIIHDKRIPIMRLGFKASFGEGFKNIKQFLKFQFAVRRWLSKNRDEYDIVHACDFDTAYFTYRLVKRKKKKFIFDIFDFWACEPKSFFQRQVKSAQFRIINKADATIICTEERRNQIVGSHPQRLAVIHNSPSDEQLPSDLIIEERTDRKPRVCYVGILQDGRLLKEIGTFFADHHEIELHIGGFGILEKYFEEIAQNNDNITYYGKLRYDKTLQLESNCDLLLAIYDPSIGNHKYAAPNKFYESLFLGKPVIMVKGTGMSSIVKEYNIGTLIDYSYEGFALGLESLLERKAEWQEMSGRMRQLYHDDFSWKTMQERLLMLYRSVMGENDVND